MRVRDVARRVVAAYTEAPGGRICTVAGDLFDIVEAPPLPPDDERPPPGPERRAWELARNIEAPPRTPRQCPVCYHEELYGPLHWLDHVAVCAAAKAERVREANRASWQRQKQKHATGVKAA